MEFNNSVGLVTKGPLIGRDKDVLADLTAEPGCSLSVKVPTVDEDAGRVLESGTAPPRQRPRAVRELGDAEGRAGVLMNPIVPGITSKPALLERTVKAITDHGASFVGCNVMCLDGGTRDHFMYWLAREFPQLVEGYSRLYPSKYAPATYHREVRAVVGLLRTKYGAKGPQTEDDDEGHRARVTIKQIIVERHLLLDAESEARSGPDVLQPDSSRAGRAQTSGSRRAGGRSRAAPA